PTATGWVGGIRRRCHVCRRPGRLTSVIALGLRNDVYRRPLATALDRLRSIEGWRCVDVGAGGGDVTVALAELVGAHGRIYAVDRDPRARDAVGHAPAAAGQAAVVALPQAGEEPLRPE